MYHVHNCDFTHLFFILSFLGLSVVDGLHFISTQDANGNAVYGAPPTLSLTETNQVVPRSLLAGPVGLNSKLSRDHIGSGLFRSVEYVRSSHLVFRAGLYQVNRALATLTYLPNPDYNGPDNVTVFCDDLGNSGSLGGPRNDSQTIPMDVRSINDAPMWSAHDGTF